MRYAAAAAITLTFAGALPAMAQVNYPPDPKPGYVTRSRIYVGECTTFGGGGFAAGAKVSITDNGRPRGGNARADSAGEFAAELCFNGNASVGEHVLVGTGPEDPTLHPGDAARESHGANGIRQVSASVTVLGRAEQEARVSAAGGNGTALPRFLPRTGGDWALVAFVGSTLAALGMVLSAVGRDRTSRRRRRTSAA